MTSKDVVGSSSSIENSRTRFAMNEKPQGWKAAKLLMQGRRFECFRCHKVFYSREEWNKHQDIDPLTYCKKYREWREENLAFNIKYQNSEQYIRRRMEMAPEIRETGNSPNSCKIWKYQPCKSRTPKDNLRAEMESINSL